MNETNEPRCPECTDPVAAAPVLDRRNFIRVAGLAALGAAGVPAVARARRDDEKPKPAEALIQELHASLSDDQKKRIVLPFDDGPKGAPKRLGMYNAAVNNIKIGDVYTKPQQELLERIVRAMVSGEDGYKAISRNGTWDGSKAFGNCGALFFGEPKKGEKYAWLFTGHHMTLRADGDFMDGAAWGGPMYYGHSPNGYLAANVFNFQTKSVLELAKAMDEKQMKKAVVVGTPGEGAPSVKFHKKDEERPGIAGTELSKDQRALVEKVMRDLISPYRKEDADEVMQILKERGGLEKLHLAFYRDKDAGENERWHFWRLEGPGFVWNYRVLPHVHCYVNIGQPV
jgi:hypothetical protein